MVVGGNQHREEGPLSSEQAQPRGWPAHVEAHAECKGPALRRTLEQDPCQVGTKQAQYNSSPKRAHVSICPPSASISCKLMSARSFREANSGLSVITADCSSMLPSSGLMEYN